MPTTNAPRHGSMAYSPRKRAQRIYPRVRSWPTSKEPQLLGFAGYKAGMTHSFVKDNRKDSPTSSKEVFTPLTIIECPPLVAWGVRTYKKTPYGLKVSGEMQMSKPSKILSRKISLPKNPPSPQTLFGDIVTLILHSQPRTATGKKTPEIFECRVGGETFEQQYNYAKDLLGKELQVTDFFKPGDFIDVSSVTKGKGMQGPVKRFHVKIQPRVENAKSRHVGTLGGRSTATRWTVPQAGQLGYLTRTEYNKRIIKIGESGGEVTPNGGFVNYGKVTGKYIAIKGSVPGPAKRLIRFRPAIRHFVDEGEPQINYLSTESKQGV
ncbi:MAG: 50S ribosomal protein L3 [archaeon]